MFLQLRKYGDKQNMSSLWLKYYYRPSQVGSQVLEVSGVAGRGLSHVYLYKPLPEHVECHVQIVKWMFVRECTCQTQWKFHF